jgi:hypothetical protein
VRLAPQQNEGYLIIAEAKENQKEVIDLIWTPRPSKQIEAMADDWQSITNEEATPNKNNADLKIKSLPQSEPSEMILSIEEGDLVIQMDNIASISTDEASKCLIVSTTSKSTYMFQFLNASPTHALSLISMAIEGNGKKSGTQKSGNEWDLDLGLKMLDAFGHVKNFSLDTATDVFNNVIKLFGSKQMRGDREEEGTKGGLRNPWILDKRIELLSSRFTGKQLNDTFFASFLRSDGSIPNWETLLKVVHFTGLDSSIRRIIWLGISLQ